MIIGPNIVTDGLVFGYDADDRSRFYKGEPTINLFTNSYFSNGTIGWTFNSWTSTSYTYEVVSCDLPNFKNALRINRIATGGLADFHQGDKYKQSTVYTISAYVRGIGNFSLSSQWGSGKTFTLTSEWQRISFTTTSSSTNNQYFYYNAGGIGNWVEITGCQIEEKSHVTPYVNGIRSATQSLIDLKKITTIDLSNVSFDSTAHPVFDGIDDVIRTTYAPQLGNFTICVVFKDEGSMSWGRIVDKSYTNGVFISSQFASGGVNYIGAGIIEPNPPHGQSLPYTSGKYHFFTVVRSGTTHKIYLDGITQTLSKTGSSALLSTTAFAFGSWSAYNNQLFKGKLPIVKIYNKALSDTDVLQNYNAYKKRFNL